VTRGFDACSENLGGVGDRRLRAGMVMRKIGLFSAALVLVACTAADHDVRFTFDQDANFSKFKTYKWVSVRDGSKVDDRWDQRIEGEVDAELAKKGLTKTNTDTADLYIGYQLGIGAETQFTPYNTSWGSAPGGSSGNRYAGVGGVTTGQTLTIHTGQLVVDMYDSKNHDLLWRGDVSKTIDPETTPDRQQTNLTSAVTKLLTHFPPATSAK
jgi:hypothetical protein